MEDFDEVRESRFAYLLQPLRELAANWSIDIATDLEDYLEQLERVEFSFEGAKALNFAEAALLIQGSTGVYSKKVEHLYNLVYQALDTIINRQQAQAQNSQPGNTRKNRDAPNSFDDEAEFDVFNDVDGVIEVGDNIALDEEEGQEHQHTIRSPSALVALDDQSTGQGDGDACLRISQCYIHVSGALLLELRDTYRYDSALNPMHSATTPNRSNQAAIPTLTPLIARTAAQQHSFPTPGPQHDTYTADEGLFYDMQPPAYDQHPGADLPPEAYDRMPPAADDAVHGDYGADDADDGEGGDNEDEDAFDPYQPLDMNDPGSQPLIPVKVVRPTRLLIRGQGRQNAVLPLSRKPASAAAKVLANADLAYALEALRRAAKGARRAQATGPPAVKRRMQTVLDWMDAATAAEQEMEDLNEMLNDGGGDDAGLGGGMDGPAFDYGGGDDDGYGPPDDHQQGMDSGDMDGGWDSGHAAGGMEWGHGPTGLASPTLASVAGGTDGLSYEDLCKVHIEKLISAAAAREVQSDLATRVAGWRDRIDPLLKEEEQHGMFDIQDYGERIIERMVVKSDGKVNEVPLDFFAVASFSLKRDVSRAFAAMLQLINNHNIAIKKLDGTTTSFELQLLNPELPHKSMGQSLPPGAQQPPAIAAAGAASAGGSRAANAGKSPQAKKQRRGKQNAEN